MVGYHILQRSSINEVWKKCNLNNKLFLCKNIKIKESSFIGKKGWAVNSITYAVLWVRISCLLKKI